MLFLDPVFFFSSRRRHTRSLCDWSSDVCSSDLWAVLGAGLFQGKIRAVVSTLGPKERGVTTEKVVIKRGQMKLFYVIDGKVALHYTGDRHLLEAGDSALLDGGTPHGLEDLGTNRARAIW